MENSEHINQLATEKSPYLRQHASNPVNWYPWGTEAFERARNENKPIFLSVGYSTCHWCHVMAHESFENNAVAALMNKYFINIKVDREERPDVDAIYMIATQALTGSGGWPMSVWLTPDLKPFFAGTYFPPDDRHGRAGFSSVLSQLAEAWDHQRDKVSHSAQQISDLLKQYQHKERSQHYPDAKKVSDLALTVLSDQFDSIHGGFGSAPKFPMPTYLSFLLDTYRRDRNTSALSMVVFTLKKMALGGIYDQLGGGFARYSTDERWLVPHFEKMLYDNAQLLSVIAELYGITQEPYWKRLALDVIEYLCRDLRHSEGGFFAAEDADSDGKEGAFYVWTVAQIKNALPADQAETIIKYYGLSIGGNFFDPHTREEGLNVLHQTTPIDVETPAVEPLVQQTRARLLSVRSARHRPHRDEKILTEWNGLVLSGLAKAARFLKDSVILSHAQKTASFVKKHLFDEASGRLYRRWFDGHRAIDAQQTDYAMLIQGLLDLAEAGDPSHIDWANKLHAKQNELFLDEELGGYFMTEMRADLILRMKDDSDNVIPSGNSVAVLNGLRLSQLMRDPKLALPSLQALQAFSASLEERPIMLTSMCVALSYASNLGLIGSRI